jgi:hypothetical protein
MRETDYTSRQSLEMTMYDIRCKMYDSCRAKRNRCARTECRGRISLPFLMGAGTLLAQGFEGQAAPLHSREQDVLDLTHLIFEFA